MKSQATDGPQAPGQAPIKTRRFSVSLVWIVPIVAVLVGISLVVHSILQEGPTITVTFKTGRRPDRQQDRGQIPQCSDRPCLRCGTEQRSEERQRHHQTGQAGRKLSPAKTRNSGSCGRALAPAGCRVSIRCCRAITSAPISARPTPGQKTSRAWKTRRPSPTANRASVSPCTPRTSVRWTSALRSTTARSRWARWWPMRWTRMAKG